LTNELNIGIIGTGGFATFAARAFVQIPGVKIIAVTDINNPLAEKMAMELNARSYIDLDSFLASPGLDLVYIATPPWLHYNQSKRALLANKHVICEKPAALLTREAEELQSLAQDLDLLYVVNLMQRYNPLYEVVKNIIDNKILGNFIHGFFENYASDEKLEPDHWFWNPQQSGGIFIEHGVHFFDMFSGWFGKGEVLNAIHMIRKGIEGTFIDRVQATVLYHGALVNFYHGFDQPSILDRQEIRLQFEKGDISLYEWVPVKIKIHGLFTKSDISSLGKLLEEHSITPHSEGTNKIAKGKFTAIYYDDHVTIESGNIAEKQTRYNEILSAMLTDQWSWIRDRTHRRIIDDNNAVDSLRIAEKATGIAQEY
jgi:predicted dehydrogenase